MFKVETYLVPSSMRRVLESYAEKLRINIRATGSEDGEERLYYPNTKKGWLEIYFFAGPSVEAYSGGREAYYQRAFGYDIGGSQSTGVTPSLIGYPIIDEEGNTIAEVVENTIYVLFDLSDDESPMSPGIAASILQEILEAYIKLPALAERQKIEGKKRMELRNESYRNFQRMFGFKILQKNTDAKKQYAYLNKIAKGDIIVVNGEIRVPLGRKQTRDSTDRRKARVNIGEIFFIMTPGNSDSGDFVEIFYLDPKYHGNHDHIYNGGNLCLGNIESGIEGFLREREFAFAAEAVKLFVEES